MQRSLLRPEALKEVSSFDPLRTFGYRSSDFVQVTIIQFVPFISTYAIDHANVMGEAMIESVNWLAVVAAAISAFVLGGIWYGPLFKNVWCRENGIDPNSPPMHHPGAVFGGALVLSLVASAVFALFLGPKPSFGFAVGAGLSAGLCWVAASFGINYLFSGRSLKLWLIDGGYHTLQFTLCGLVLGLWH